MMACAGIGSIGAMAAEAESKAAAKRAARERRRVMGVSPDW